MFFDVGLMWFPFMLVHWSDVVLLIVCLVSAFVQKRNEKKEASEKKYYESKNFINGE
jgi:hypothetical protein